MWLIYLLIRHHVSYNYLVINEFILIFVFIKSISQIKMRVEGLHFVCRSYVQIFICLLHFFYRIIQEFNTSLVTISDDKETTTFLKLRALAFQTPLTDDQINR